MKRLSLLAAVSLLAMLVFSPAAFAQGDFDCNNFSTQTQAQATLAADPSDPNNLDADGDGVACEGLLTAPISTPDGDVPRPVEGTVANPGSVPCTQVLSAANAPNLGTTGDELQYGTDRVFECGQQLYGVQAEQPDTGGDQYEQPGAGGDQYDDGDMQPPATGGDNGGGMTELPDTGGLPLGGVAAGLGAMLVAGGLLVRRRLS